ncbi:selenide, water dikinase SelD, partial [Escherichia coli]
ILHSEREKFVDPRLLVGNETRDDAAVYDIGNGVGIISTTDFFMPIVDDPFDFGRIAAANAISDVYAMGGKPIMAIAILGWPIAKLPPEVAQQVIDGGRFACQQAGIALAGGHS